MVDGFVGSPMAISKNTGFIGALFSIFVGVLTVKLRYDVRPSSSAESRPTQ